MERRYTSRKVENVVNPFPYVAALRIPSAEDEGTARARESKRDIDALSRPVRFSWKKPLFSLVRKLSTSCGSICA